MAAPERIVACDVETSGLSWRKDSLCGVAICCEEDQGIYYPVEQFYTLHHLELQNRGLPKVFHNANFDLKFLGTRGIKLDGAIYDTLLMAQLIDENQPLDLKSLSVKYLGPDSIKHAEAIWAWLTKKGLKKADLVKAPPELLKAYAEEDVNNTYKLFYVFWDKLEQLNIKVKQVFGTEFGPMDYYRNEAQPVDYVLGGMELRGIKINLPLLQQKKQELEEEINKRIEALNALLHEEIQKVSQERYQAEVDKKMSPRGKANVKFPVFNWGSTDQVGDLFYTRLGLCNHLQIKTDTGKWKCSDEVWEQALKLPNLDQKLFLAIKYFSDIKALQKKMANDIGGFNAKGTPVGLASKIDGDRVYPHFKQIGGMFEGEAAGTVTGRLSVSCPNTQNQQPFAKPLFIPDSEEFVFAHFDYSMIEMRIAAHLSQDPLMLQRLRAGEDLHKALASKLYGNIALTKQQRNAGKGANFLFIYNGSEWRLQTQLQGWGIQLKLEDCAALKQAFFDDYKIYKQYIDEQQTKMLRYKVVVAQSGRVRRLPELRYYDGLDFQSRTYKGAYKDELKEWLDSRPPNKQMRVFSDGTKKKLTLFDVANGKCRHAFNQGYNFPVQSLGGSITKCAMLALNKLGFDIVNQVHDSIVLQIKKCEIQEKVDEAKCIMENVVKLSVPILVDVKLANSFDDEHDIYTPHQIMEKQLHG